MENGKTVAAGVAVGYLLGRTRRMKLALMIGAVAVGRRLDLTGLANRGLELVQSSTGGKGLPSAAPGQLARTGRLAAAAAVGKGIDTLSDNLERRAERLRDDGEAAGEESAAEPDADEQPAEQDNDGKPRGSKKSSGSSKKKSTTSGKRTSTNRSGGGKRRSTADG